MSPRSTIHDCDAETAEARSPERAVERTNFRWSARAMADANAGSEPVAPGVPGDAELRKAWEVMKRVVGAQAPGRFATEDVEDIASGALREYWQARERSTVRSLEAFQVTIASRRAIAAMRRKRPPVDPIDEHPGFEPPAPPPDPERLGREELEFYVAMLLDLLDARCAEIFRRWLRVLSVTEVARQLGKATNTVVQSWGRCRRRALRILLADDGPLGEFGRDVMGLP
jgi:DNA-directed RNA polymerase specialized sigma24 family protein